MEKASCPGNRTLQRCDQALPGAEIVPLPFLLTPATPPHSPPGLACGLQTSPLQLLSGGGGASLLATLGMLLLQTLAGTSSAAGGMQATQVALGAAPLMSSLLSAAAGAGGAVGPTGSAAAAAGQVMAAMPEVAIEGVATQALLSGGNSPQAPSWGASSGGLFDEQ